MAISTALLSEFDHEMATSRTVIERVPENKYSWKPHEKSMSAGRLASHIAEMPTWASTSIQQDSLDLAGGYQPYEAASRAELLALFDKNVAGARASIAGCSDETFMKMWSLTNSGKTLMTMPKIAVVRSFVMNHVIHHRGQLSVYLRELNVPVPSIYGPSADEGSMG
jgi:uncharacterized damage-inducible protein DinB